MDFALEKYSRGRRGAPAKGVGRETGARVQIPPSPPEQPLGFFERLLFFQKFQSGVGFEPEAPGTGGGAGTGRRQWRKQGEARTAAVGTRQGGTGRRRPGSGYRKGACEAGSNPSFSAKNPERICVRGFPFSLFTEAAKREIGSEQRAVKKKGVPQSTFSTCGLVFCGKSAAAEGLQLCQKTFPGSRAGNRLQKNRRVRLQNHQ